MTVVPQNDAVRRRRLMRRFREAGATDADGAMTLESLGERQSHVFEQMLQRRVFLPANDGRFVMDERAADEYLRQCQLRGWLVTAIFVFLAMLFWLLGRTRR